MKRIAFLSALAGGVALMTSPAWAAGEFVSFTANPINIETKVHTFVSLTAVLFSPSLRLDSATLQRQQPDGSWKQFANVTFVKTANPVVYTGKFGIQESSTSTVRLRLSAVLKKGGPKVFSPVEELFVGVTVGPSSQPTVIEGPAGSGLTLTIPPNALHIPAKVGIGSAPKEVIEDPAGGRPRAATVDVILVPSTDTDAQVLTAPLQLSVPAPAAAPPDALFYFTQRVQGPPVTGPQGGLEAKLVVMDTGKIVNGQIVTQTDVFSGIWGGGVVAVIQETGSGTVKGIICDPSVPQASCTTSTLTAQRGRGAWVQEQKPPNTNNVGFYTDGSGQYSTVVNAPKSGNDFPFTVIVTDGFRCATGTRAGDLGTTGATITDFNISLSRVAAPSWNPVFAGLRNSGFEAGSDTCWTASSGATVDLLQAGAPPSPAFRDLFGFNTAIAPAEADQAITIRTNNATVEQRIKVPKGVTTLHFDFNFGCLASNTTCNAPASLTTVASRLDIQFRAELVLPSGFTTTLTDTTTFTQQMRGFGGQLGWRTGKLELGGIQVPNPANGNALESLPGSSVPITIKFTATNLATTPNIDAAVLIDNVRFDTVFMVANIIKDGQTSATAATSAADVKQHIRDANELLSQAGTNVRLRKPVQTIDTGAASLSACNPDTFTFVGAGEFTNTATKSVTIDGVTKKVRSDATVPVELRPFSCFGTSAHPDVPTSDVQIFYVDSIQDTALGLPVVYGVAVTPEDYFGESPPTELNYNAADPLTNGFNGSAIVLSHLTDPDRAMETPGHELGHLLLHKFVINSRPVAGSTLEHASTDRLSEVGLPPDIENIMTDKQCVGTSSAPCTARVFLSATQANRWELPGPPPGPTCPNVTCPH